MKLSKDTIAILKSFSGINQGIVLEAGNTIQTNSEGGDVYVKAVIPEKIPVSKTDMAIYDVPAFINTLNLFDDAEITMEADKYDDGFAQISSGRNSCNFYFTDPDFISHGVWLPLEEKDYIDGMSFDLSADDIKNIQRASAIMSLDQLEFVNIDGKLTCNVVERQVASNNSYALELGDVDKSADFKLIMRVAENFKLYVGNYKVRIAKIKGTFVFCAENINSDINYQIAMDRDSFYN